MKTSEQTLPSANIPSTLADRRSFEVRSAPALSRMRERGTGRLWAAAAGGGAAFWLGSRGAFRVGGIAAAARGRAAEGGLVVAGAWRAARACGRLDDLAADGGARVR